MDRRRFLLTSVAGALVTPLVGEAQQSGKSARIGFLSSSTTSVSSPLLISLRRGLKDLGYEEGKHVVIEYRFAESREQISAMAADLARLQVVVILAGGSEAIAAAKKATTTIPIVMTNSGDAVNEGFVASLARPDGNITGLTQISPALTAKRVEILKEVVPKLGRIAVLWNPVHANTPLTFRETRLAAARFGLRVVSLEVRERKDFDEAFMAFARDRPAAVIVLRDPLTVRHRTFIIEAMVKVRVPAIYETDDDVTAGGLMSYGPDFAELFYRSAAYVDKILKGAKPSDLPVEQPTRYELVINLQTAKALGLTIPPSLLLRADHVIE